MHQPTKRIRVFTAILFHAAAPRQLRAGREEKTCANVCRSDPGGGYLPAIGKEIGSTNFQAAALPAGQNHPMRPPDANCPAVE
jgi:hypothetical protein